MMLLFTHSRRKNGGFKNFRTYEGMKYKGGFSDHLPIFVKMERKRV